MGSSVPKHVPFRAPQETTTVLRYSIEMCNFLGFLITNLLHPILNYPVPLHPKAESALRDLLAKLRTTPIVQMEVIESIHLTFWYLLEFPSKEYLKNDRLCPFTLFLIAFHVQDGGSFNRANGITPWISCVEWGFRATAVEESLRRAREFEGDGDRAFHECVEVWISESRPCLFNSLRQTMHYLSALSIAQQGLSRFMWSRDRRTLSMDGFPVYIPSFIEKVASVLSSVTHKVERLFRGCEYLDILEHIHRSMVPDKSGRPRWFVDGINEKKHLYSFLEEEQNGFKDFRPRLLIHLSQRSELFSSVNGKLVVLRRRCL